MKNVTKILIAVVLCAAMFASELRTKALGGAQFWPGDESNIVNFPAQANNHGYVQLSGIGLETEDTSGSASVLFQKDGTTWGFNYGNSDWVNMVWGDGTQGVSFGFANMTNNDTVNPDEAAGYSLGYGNTFGFGELGVSYMDDGVEGSDATLDVHMKSDFGFWLFDNTYVAAKDLTGDMKLRADFFSHMDAGGADVVYGWGIDMDMADVGFMHQTATIGVEANMTDWATFRAGYEWTHVLSDDGTTTETVDQIGTGQVGTPDTFTDACTGGVGADSAACGTDGGEWGPVSNNDATDNYAPASDNYAPAYDYTHDNATGVSTGKFSWGLGFNWGGLTADFSVSSSLLLDPVGLVSARDAVTGLTDTGITLTYSF